MIYGPSITLLDIKDSLKAFTIGSGIGTIIGIIPGMGALAGSFLSYSTTKQVYNSKSKTGDFGKSALPGVVAAEAGNSAVSGANLLLLLTLGIPGSSVAARFLAALMLQGITPGPGIFEKHGPMLYALFVAFILANFLNIILANLIVKPSIKLLKSDLRVVFPIVAIISFVGVYSVNNRMLDLGVMVFFGALSFFMNKAKIPIGPMVISFILAPYIERNFRRALGTSLGDFSIFINSPINITLIIMCLILVIYVFISRKNH